MGGTVIVPTSIQLFYQHYSVGYLKYLYNYNIRYLLFIFTEIKVVKYLIYAFVQCDKYIYSMMYWYDWKGRGYINFREFVTMACTYSLFVFYFMFTLNIILQAPIMASL